LNLQYFAAAEHKVEMSIIYMVVQQNVIKKYEYTFKTQPL